MKGHGKGSSVRTHTGGQAAMPSRPDGACTGHVRAAEQMTWRAYVDQSHRPRTKGSRGWAWADAPDSCFDVHENYCTVHFVVDSAGFVAPMLLGLGARGGIRTQGRRRRGAIQLGALPVLRDIVTREPGSRWSRWTRRSRPRRCVRRFGRGHGRCCVSSAASSAACCPCISHGPRPLRIAAPVWQPSPRLRGTPPHGWLISLACAVAAGALASEPGSCRPTAGTGHAGVRGHASTRCARQVTADMSGMGTGAAGGAQGEEGGSSRHPTFAAASTCRTAVLAIGRQRCTETAAPSVVVP